MDDTVEVKWDQPLEAVGPSGQIAAVSKVELNSGSSVGFNVTFDIGDDGGEWPWFSEPNGRVPVIGWTIRNTAPKPAQEPVQGRKGREVAPEVVERLIALCGAVAGVSGQYMPVKLPELARAIQALLEPVETDEQRAEKIHDAWERDKIEGIVDAIAQGIALGRKLERQAIEKER